MQDLWQNAFICLWNWGCIKFSLLLFLITVALLVCLYAKNKNKKNEIINPIKIWKGLRPGERNEINGIIAVYVLILLAALLPSKPIQILSFLTKPAEGFLVAEPLIWIVEILLVIGSALIKGSKREYLNTVNAVSRILIFVSVASTILIQQVPLCWYNILWFLAVGALLVCLKLLSMMQPSKVTTEGGLYAPINRYEDLFPPRQKQADELCQIIGSEFSGGLSICVAGPWGSGKTSLVLGAWEKLRKNSATSGYEYIFLHAMELDSLSSLFSYLFSRIREILKARGAYVGPGSEYRRLIASAGGLITSSQLSSVLERKLFYEEDDYRSQRERLEATMEKVLQKDKLVIVVDDIERCDPEKAREFLYFVKEIATMKCCVSIFITDDKYLPVPTHIEREKEIFFDKFFNYRIVLCPLQLLDMMRYYERKLEPAKAMGEFHLDLPSVIYQKLLEHLRQWAESAQGEIGLIRGFNLNQSDRETDVKERQAYLYTCTERLGEPLSRPRTILKFYETYRRICERLYKYYSEQSREQLKEYFKTLELAGLLFLPAYVEVCFPMEWEEILGDGFRTYLGRIQESQGEPKRFLSELIQSTLRLCDSQSSLDVYQENKRIRFLDTLLTSPEELPNIVNGFTTQEHEWFDAIEKGDTQVMDANWSTMLQKVVEHYSTLKENVNSDKGRVYLERLIQFAKEQVTSKHWKVDTLLQAVEQVNPDRQDSFNGDCIVPLASLLDTEISEEPFLAEVSEQAENRLRVIMSSCLHDYFGPICGALLYAAPQEREVITNAWRKIRTDHQEQITSFLVRVQKCEIWRKRFSENLKGLNGLETLLEDAKEILMEKDHWKYPDIQEIFKLANDSIKESKSLLHLLDQIHIARTRDSGSCLSAAIQNKNLSGAISCIEGAFQRHERIQRGLHELFEYIQCYKPGEISPQELLRLHDLVTQYYELKPFGYWESTVSFRETLLALEEQSQNRPAPV